MSYLSVCVILVQEPANNPWASWQIPTILVMVGRKNLWGSYLKFERNRVNHIVQPTLWCLKPHLVLTSFSLTPPSCDSQGSQLRIPSWGSSHCCFNDQCFHLTLCSHLGQGWANQFLLPHVNLSYNWRLFRLLQNLLNSILCSSYLIQRWLYVFILFLLPCFFAWKDWTWGSYGFYPVCHVQVSSLT